MATVATLTDFKNHLGDTSQLDFSTQTDADAYLQELLDGVEGLLEGAVGRTFHAAGTTTDETQSGRGFPWIYVDRPVGTLTSVKVGFDPADPDFTLDQVPDEIQVVGDNADKVMRRDGGVFPAGDGNLHATYDHQAFPTGGELEVAKRAVVEGATFIVRRRGSEHAASTSIGQFGSTQFAALWSKLPFWRKAVRQLNRLRVA